MEAHTCTFTWNAHTNLVYDSVDYAIYIIYKGIDFMMRKASADRGYIVIKHGSCIQ